MSITLASDNTIFRAISYTNNRKNILYEPTWSLLDHILCLSQNQYITISNNIKAIADNHLVIPKEHYAYYNYNCIVTTNLENHLDGSLSQSLHAPILFIINSIKNYKKEDRHLIQKRISNHTKLFFDEHAYNLFRSENSYLVDLGVPLDIFKSIDDYESRKDICILEYGSVSSSIKSALNQINIDADIIHLSSDITDIASKLNRYKICIDISEKHKINLLCAAACGCYSLTLDPKNSLGNIIRGCTQQQLVSQIKEIINTPSIKPDVSKNREYIENHHCINKFINQYNTIINNISHEAFIL